MKNKKSKIKKVRWQPILVAVSIAAAAVLVAAVFGIYGKSGDKAVVESLPLVFIQISKVKLFSVNFCTVST